MRNSVNNIHHTANDSRVRAGREGGVAFDAAAASYDAGAARNPMMRWLRRESLRSLLAAFRPHQRVLEVGCGTGEEAVELALRGVRVVATDASPAMVELTARKLAARGFAEDQSLALVLPVEELRRLADGTGAQAFDGAYSSLGALNCAADLAATARTLGMIVRPGGTVVVSLLGKYCLWETLWYLVHGNPHLAFRRWRGEALGTAIAGGPNLVVYYWSFRRIEREFSRYFDILERRAMSWALPPTYAAMWLKGRPRLFSLLCSLERRTARLWPFYSLGDHVLLVMRRKG